ncbi:MAG: enoyl-CoA hydratase/isomerase family protein [Propionibacteriaceae bacterium]|jgi:enoyl-CoA hydratase|nr:enoyl-CoA hydratase/isomerase family protein [Propionibacteriaceae bacterium]
MSVLRFEIADSVATLTITRPEALNALNTEVLTELGETLSGIRPNEVRAVLITGEGDRAFVAGGDIGEMSGMTSRQGAEFSRLGNRIFRTLETLPMPTIAAVNGYALGGGCELALSCDIRVASTKAIFGQPEVGLGITPGFGGTQRLARVVGVALAKEIIFTGRNLKADRALAIGLVNAVVEPEKLMSTAFTMATEIASKAPYAVRVAKAAIDLGLATDMDSGLALEAVYFGTCFETHDQIEGMAAFIDKRKPTGFTDN